MTIEQKTRKHRIIMKQYLLPTLTGLITLLIWQITVVGFHRAMDITTPTDS